MPFPNGQTRTCTVTAVQIGHPNADRAVGHANATNPMPLVIPCHRVIGADGTSRFGGQERVYEMLTFPLASTRRWRPADEPLRRPHAGDAGRLAPRAGRAPRQLGGRVAQAVSLMPTHRSPPFGRLPATCACRCGVIFVSSRARGASACRHRRVGGARSRRDAAPWSKYEPQRREVTKTLRRKT